MHSTQEFIDEEEAPRSVVQRLDSSRSSLGNIFAPVNLKVGCSPIYDMAALPHAGDEKVAMYAVASGDSSAGAPTSTTNDSIYSNADALEDNEPLYAPVLRHRDKRGFWLRRWRRRGCVVRHGCR